MDDIALLADRLLLMSHGAIAYDGNVEHFMSLTPMTKRLIVDFVEPLKNELELSSHLKIPAGAIMFDRSLSSDELLEYIKIISTETSIRDLKIEEPDFEDVIHTFLEKESSLHKTRNSK
jgi:ABC-2 type transport system ATP-binding protein